MIAASLVAATAEAEDAVRLAKAEVEAMTAGKEVKFTRADGNTVTWDFRKDGSVWYAPRNAQRAITIGGTYTIDDDGGICLKWREDKYVRLQDGCYYFVRDGGRTRITGHRNPERIVGEVE